MTFRAAAVRQPKPPPPDPFEIGRLGSAWSILGLDSTRKRGLGRCLACGIVREITVVDGIPACDCSGSRDRTLASVGQDFHTLADTIERSAEIGRIAQSDRPAARQCADHRAMARWILNSGARLSPKEWAFVADMANRFGSLSERQSAWLQALFERVSSESRRA
jgi:hypothetical protein